MKTKNNNVNPFFIEAGINHFGKTIEANLILRYFLKSEFKNLTFMLHSKNFYLNQKKKGFNFELTKSFYKNAIDLCHKKKKKIGLSVSSEQNFVDYMDLNFDFFKLLSLNINNFKLINLLKKKNRPVYVSTGHGAKDLNIKKCLKAFGDLKKKITILHTPMTYNPAELNLFKISHLREKFKLPVGYSNHNDDINSLNALSAYNPTSIFIYCKPLDKKKRIYPDNRHAFFFDELENLRVEYKNYYSMHFSNKIIKKVKIFTDEFRF